MALSNKERQKRWLEKNRALHNFRRRKKGGDASCEVSSANSLPVLSNAALTVQPVSAAKSKIEELRELVRVEQEKPSTEARTKPDVVGGIYRNDSGGVISKFAWEKLQKMKEKAKEGGYTLDEYSQ